MVFSPLFVYFEIFNGIFWKIMQMKMTAEIIGALVYSKFLNFATNYVCTVKRQFYKAFKIDDILNIF